MKLKTSVIVCSDSFKGSLSSRDVGSACRDGILEAMPDAEVKVFTVADGGEGTIDAIRDILDCVSVKVLVHGPLGDQIEAQYLISADGKTAYIEIAAAAGLMLVPKELRNPLYTSTFGVGEIIADAKCRGCKKFIIGVGGSATNDGGIGMLQALGFRFFDANHNELGQGGQELTRIKSIEIPKPSIYSDDEFVVMCDVANPLTGPTGASAVFAPQKGATPEIVKELDAGLRNFAEVIRNSGLEDIEYCHGAGAAGGLGGAFKAFLNAKLCRGIDLMLELNGFKQALANASLVITGEGSIDEQTLFGKVPFGVLKLAKSHNVPVIAIAGNTNHVAQLNDAGFLAVIPIVHGPCSLAHAMHPKHTRENIIRTVSQTMRIWSFNQDNHN